MLVLLVAVEIEASSEVADWGLDGATHSPVPRDWMGPPTLRYQGNVHGPFRPFRPGAER